MDSKTFVEILSVVRHDYLNHLQVVSGLVQLNKADRVKDYIKQVCSELAVLSKLSHLKNPEISEFLLMLYYIGEKNQINVVYNVDDSIERCSIEDDLLSYILKEAFVLSMDYLIAQGYHQKELSVTVEKNSDSCYIKVISCKPDVAEAMEAERKAAELNDRLVPYGGYVDISLTEGKGLLIIKLPVA